MPSSGSVPLPGAGFLLSLQKAFRRCYCLHLRVGDILATLVDDFPPSCHTSFPGSFALNMVSFGSVLLINVAALDVGVPALCRTHTESPGGLI